MVAMLPEVNKRSLCLLTLVFNLNGHIAQISTQAMAYKKKRRSHGCVLSRLSHKPTMPFKQANWRHSHVWEHKAFLVLYCHSCRHCHTPSQPTKSLENALWLIGKVAIVVALG
jgi:hypothetical protein